MIDLSNYGPRQEGMVTSFDKDSQTGVLQTSNGTDIEFHFAEGKVATDAGATVTLIDVTCVNHPKMGDALFFWEDADLRGHAMLWCFADEWEAVHRQIKVKPRYRLMKHEKKGRLTQGPFPFWEGTDLTELDCEIKETLPPDTVIGSRQKTGTNGNWYHYWFEVETRKGSNQWQRCDDPR